MSDDLMNEIAAAKDKSSIIMVVGVGGAGGNAVNHMWNLGIKDVGFMVCNTDAQALDNSPVEEKVQLGREGLGAGNDPENGRKAAIESLDDIRRRLEAAGTRMLFVTAGMGGGTGTGASPVIAKLAHEMGILTVGIVTSPLAVEGKIRYEQAFRGIEELSRNVDSLLVINNENIVEMYGRLSLKQAFGKADDILASAAKGIAEIITVESDMVNVDFADVSKVMRDSGRAHMSVATAEGEHRAAEVARASLESPLLDHTLISGAKNILLNISTSDADSLALDEVMEILKYIQSHASVQAPDGTVELEVFAGTRLAFTPRTPLDLPDWFARADAQDAEKKAAEQAKQSQKGHVEKGNKDTPFRCHIAKVNETEDFGDEAVLSDEDFVLGVRPEFLSISEHGALEAEVYSAMPTGMETTVKLRIGEYLLTGVIFGGVLYQIGQKVRVDFEGDHMVLFSRKNGRIITQGSLSVRSAR